jgi:predicted CoA-binding protein
VSQPRRGPDPEACELTRPLALTAEEQHRFQDPGHIGRLLAAVQHIAVVGLSRRPERPSHYVPAYLQQAGYRVTPVTPHAGPILGLKTVPDLLSLPGPVDLALVFRPGPLCIGVAEQAVSAGIPRIWFQRNIDALDAARFACAHGLEVVLDRCMMVEHRRRVAYP